MGLVHTLGVVSRDPRRGWGSEKRKPNQLGAGWFVLSLFTMSVFAVGWASFKVASNRARGAVLATVGFILTSFTYALIDDVLVKWRMARLQKAREAKKACSSSKKSD